MRVVVITSKRRGIASRCLPVLHENPRICVTGVVLVNGTSVDRIQRLKRRIKKVRGIGILGAINGLLLRRWYEDVESEDIELIANVLGIPFETTPATNCERTRELFRKGNADLGICLGNGYIAESVFTIPRFGMINIHGEVLPRFRGAQSVIWPIYEEIKETGFTIHQIDKGIDTGDILYRDDHPIVFYPRLRKTVEKNVEITRKLIPRALSLVCEQYETLRGAARKHKSGRAYTTPSFWQFLRMAINNQRFYKRGGSSY